jgi:hypothetical protein
MRPRPTQVAEQVGVGAAGVFQGARPDGSIASGCVVGNSPFSGPG